MTENSNADSYFTIGSTHKVCQDYALHHSYPLTNSNYALIGDGCSGVKNSDFGSRLLVKSIEPLFKTQGDLICPSDLIEAFAKNYVFTKALGLNEDCLCSTLIAAYQKNNCFLTFMIGDGVVAGIKHSGEIVVREIEFASGAPYYLYYELSEIHKKGYFEQFGKEGFHREHTYDPKTETVTTKELPWDFDNGGFMFCDIFTCEEYKAVAIMTDGAKSFVQDQRTATGRQGVPVPLMDVVKEILAFKSYVGEFVQRRCLKAFKQFKSEGIQNTDDFSLAVLMKDQ